MEFIVPDFLQLDIVNKNNVTVVHVDPDKVSAQDGNPQEDWITTVSKEFNLTQEETEYVRSIL